MATDDGLVENHYYRDLRWITAGDYARWVIAERELLEHPELLEAEEETDDLVENEVWASGLDPGVATTVAALAAIGACPVTSCNGFPGHYETHPLVLVWCNEEQLSRILRAAEEVGVEVTGVSTPGVLVWSRAIDKMMAFAASIMRT